MKNIVICCDGTGNEIDHTSENISNVLKIFRCLRKSDKTSPRQVVFYDPGVGTLRRPNPWLKAFQDAFAVFGLVTGYGLDENVLTAYEFIAEYYEPGDQIFMFGFSRGAFTVRMVAGLIHKIGLLAPENKNLTGIGLAAFKQFDENNPIATTLNEADEEGPIATSLDPASQFARTTSSRWPIIRFVGVWDTVASVIVPRPDRLYVPSVQEFRHILVNPSVASFRQAISIDERRRMYRLQEWEEGQSFWRNRYVPEGMREPQDSQQVWFAGAHADIGGGYPEIQSGLSKYPLIWMIEEAVKAGLTFNTRTVNQLAWGAKRKLSAIEYSPPSVIAVAHNSLTLPWRIFEYLPKLSTDKEWPRRRSYLGLYIPNGEPRCIPNGARIHGSVIHRMNALRDYRPVNLPTDYEIVPMPISPVGQDSTEFGQD